MCFCSLQTNTNVKDGKALQASHRDLHPKARSRPFESFADRKQAFSSLKNQRSCGKTHWSKQSSYCTLQQRAIPWGCCHDPSRDQGFGDYAW